MKKRLALLFCLVSLPAVPSKAAVDTEQAAPTQTITENDVQFLTLTRRPTLESKLPTNVTRLNEDDIRRSGAVNVADVLDLVPGVDLLRSGSIGSLTTIRMRGVPRSNEVQVLIDDQPLGGVSVQEINLALIP